MGRIGWSASVGWQVGSAGDVDRSGVAVSGVRSVAELRLGGGAGAADAAVGVEIVSGRSVAEWLLPFGVVVAALRGGGCYASGWWLFGCWVS